MGSFDRSKKRIQVWKKALFHFSLCFVMGFFTGFAPTSTASFFSGQVVSYRPSRNLEMSVEPIESLEKPVEVESLNRSTLISAAPAIAPVVSGNPNLPPPIEDEELELEPRGLLIIITTTRSNNPFQEVFLRRLAHTLRLVPPPLLWIVVESHLESSRTAEMLRNTGIMYRHLVFKENFTDPAAEVDHQRNVALNHIEHHHLHGIVHFADAANIYDLEFFEEIREIEVFGTWPIALLSANRKRVVVEGPVCSSSQVVGWHQKDISSGTTIYTTTSTTVSPDTNNGSTDTTPPTINISGFAFNSSILWDPERWGRPSSVPDTSQDSIKFVQQVVLEDESKLRAIPLDCSRIMLWHLHIPRALPSNHSLPSHQNQNRR